MFHDDMIMYANICVLLTIDQRDEETWHEQQENKGKDKLKKAKEMQAYKDRDKKTKHDIEG